MNLKIVTHNINGIRTNHIKLSSILNWCSINQIDILALNETNCEEKDATFKLTDHQKKDYQFIWSTKDESKQKGSGVALIFRKTWSKYYYGCTIFSPYLIQVKFLFYGRELIVWAYYIPPNNKEITDQISSFIQMHQIHSRSAKIFDIWLGDTNATHNLILDKTPSDSTSTSHNRKIFNIMESADLIDSFRAMNPSKIDFTWSNPPVSTRIDHIWIPQPYMKFLKWIQHVDSNFIT